MKTLRGGVASLLLACGIAWAGPVTVYDVGVAPDSPNKKVTVTYRLAETNSGIANVSMNISSNAGTTWTVPANTYYPGSDIGPGIPANGSLRQLVWDARVDWNQQYSTQMMVRLNATAVDAPNCIYYSVGTKFYRMNLDGSASTLLYTGLPKSVLMTADPAHNRVLFSSWYSGSPVLSYNTLQGGNVTTLCNGPGYSGGQGIAYDAATSTIFAGLYYNGVYAYNENTAQGWTRLVSAANLSPMIGQRGQLEVDPANQHIYFRSAYNGDCGLNCRRIWRVNYDGTGLTQIVPYTYSDAMTLDLTANKIYYSDSPGSGDTIKRSNLDGSGVETILTLPAPYGAYQCEQFGLDVAGGKLYMYLVSNADSWHSRAIARISLDGSNFEVLKTFSDTAEGFGLCLFIR